MDDIAVDIGGTQLRAALYPSEGIEARAIKTIPTQGEQPALERLFMLLASIWPKDDQVHCIALGAPGALGRHRRHAWRCLRSRPDRRLRAARIRNVACRRHGSARGADLDHECRAGPRP